MDFGSAADFLNVFVALGVGISVWRLGSMQARLAKREWVKESRVIFSYIYPDLVILRLRLISQADWLSEHIGNFAADEWRDSVLGKIRTYDSPALSKCFTRIHVLPEREASELAAIAGSVVKLHELAITFQDKEHPRTADELHDIAEYLVSEMRKISESIENVLNVIRALNLRIDANPKSPAGGEFG